MPTFFFVSATPGLCMTLALSLGMTIGVRRTLWMMAGELVGVAVVALATLAGVATIMLAYPEIFMIFKLVGGSYLAFSGYSALAIERSDGSYSRNFEARLDDPNPTRNSGLCHSDC